MTLSSRRLITAFTLCVCLVGCAHQTQTVGTTSSPTAIPKGYTIAEIAVNDAVAYRDYVAAVTPLIAKHGGVYLVRAGKVVAKEGATPLGRMVVIEFPSYTAAETFYDSAEYQAIITLRTKVATSRILLVEGTPR